MSIQILLDSGSRAHQNVGDVALLVACHGYLRELWPDARFTVLSEKPRRLERLLPEARAVLMQPPRAGSRPDGGWRARLRRRRTFLRRGSMQAALTGRVAYLPRALRSAIAAADVVAVSGCGVLTDLHPDNATRRLALLSAARRRGKITAMFGQGIAPIADPRLLRAARATLPGLDMLSVREPIYASRLAADFGADPSRILLTGEEAVEMAFAARAADEGKAVGVVLRVHPDVEFSAWDEQQYGAVQASLRAVSRSLGAALAPIYTTVGDMRRFRDAFAPELAWPDAPPAPEETIASIAECRLVVTFSYHAAVFALSQGIPVIGLVRNLFSTVRFTGLGSAFGRGLRVLSFSDPRLAETLERGVRELWDAAADLRPGLLGDAEKQIERTRLAYGVFHRLVPPSVG